MRYVELFEKRRGGVLNPKVDIFGELRKYVSSGEHYISFVVMDKLGINPRSGYSTPIGIYSYPVIDKVMKPILSDRGFRSIPFMRDSPYIFLFKPKRIDRGLYLSDYRKNDYDSDVLKLREYMFSRDARFTDSVFSAIEVVARRDAKVKNESGWIWNLTRLLGRLLSGEDRLKSYTLGKLAYNDRVMITGGSYYDRIKDTLVNGMGKLGKVGEVIDIFDDGYVGVRVKVDSDIYDEFEINIDDLDLVPPIDVKYMSLLKKIRDDIGMDVNATKSKSVNPKWKISDVDIRYGIITLVGLDNGNKFEVSIPRFLRANPEYDGYVGESVDESLMEYKKDSKRVNRSSVMWTYLLYRVLGYEFVDDSYGSGLIYDNEPYQAVFFNRGFIDIVERFDNPDANLEYGLTFDNIFKVGNTVEYVEGIDPKVMHMVLRNKMKKIGDSKLSGFIPSKFMGHVVVSSSKLQAGLIIHDFGMVDYLKNISSMARGIIDDYIIKTIRDIKLDIGGRNDVNDIIEYVRFFHGSGWDLIEDLIVEKSIGSSNISLLIRYYDRVRFFRDPRIEDYLLKNELHYVPIYAKKMGSRWLAGERELLKLPQGSWIVGDYLQKLKMDYSQLGK